MDYAKFTGLASRVASLRVYISKSVINDKKPKEVLQAAKLLLQQAEGLSQGISDAPDYVTLPKAQDLFLVARSFYVSLSESKTLDLGNKGKAAYELAKLYKGGFAGISADLEKYIESIKQAAHYGNVDALYDLAILYQTGGNGYKVNHSVACNLWMQAAKKGHEASRGRLQTLLTHTCPTIQLYCALGLVGDKGAYTAFKKSAEKNPIQVFNMIIQDVEFSLTEGNPELYIEIDPFNEVVQRKCSGWEIFFKRSEFQASLDLYSSLLRDYASRISGQASQLNFHFQEPMAALAWLNIMVPDMADKYFDGLFLAADIAYEKEMAYGSKDDLQAFLRSLPYYVRAFKNSSRQSFIGQGNPEHEKFFGRFQLATVKNILLKKTLEQYFIFQDAISSDERVQAIAEENLIAALNESLLTPERKKYLLKVFYEDYENINKKKYSLDYQELCQIYLKLKDRASEFAFIHEIEDTLCNEIALIFLPRGFRHNPDDQDDVWWHTRTYQKLVEYLQIRLISYYLANPDRQAAIFKDPIANELLRYRLGNSIFTIEPRPLSFPSSNEYVGISARIISPAIASPVFSAGGSTTPAMSPADIELREIKLDI